MSVSQQYLAHLSTILSIPLRGIAPALSLPTCFSEPCSQAHFPSLLGLCITTSALIGGTRFSGVSQSFWYRCRFSFISGAGALERTASGVSRAYNQLSKSIDNESHHVQRWIGDFANMRPTPQSGLEMLSIVTHLILLKHMIIF